MDVTNFTPRVFLFPWLAYGHISPFLELAKKLSERGFYIYLCSTPINLKSIEKKVSKNDSFPIQLVEFHLPSSPELPPRHHTTNGLPPHLFPTLREALKMAKPSLSNILKSLKPSLIVHDPLVSWVAAVASEHNIQAVRFLTGSAAICSYFWHAAHRPGIEFPFPKLRLDDFERANFDRLVGSMRSRRDPQEDETPQRLSDIMLIKSSREIEAKYIDYLSGVSNTKIIPVGPLVQDPTCDDNQGETVELIEWLGKKNEYSTVFISFGSECYLNKEEMEEVAFGLELSHVNFIWVIRFPAGEKNMSIEDTLPEGFLGRIGDRGKVVEGWAPQAKILSHQSVGGFVSHCGWNSTLESLGFGVPLIAVPMHFDQPLNAKLMVEVGIAVEVMRDDNGKLERDEIAKVIKDVIVGDMAKQVRKQVRDVRQKVKMRENEEIDQAFELLAQICDKDTRNNDL